MRALAPSYYKYLTLLKHGAFERRGGRWRFGTRPIADSVVDRLTESGRVRVDGDRVHLIDRRAAP